MKDPRSVTKLILLACLALLLGAAARASAQGSSATLWQDVNESQMAPGGERLIVPQQYRTLALDLAGVRRLLQAAPAASEVNFLESPVLIELPLPDGTIVEFRVVEASIMEAELQAKYPEIRTYQAASTTPERLKARLDLTPAGFHAVIFTAQGTVFIDPYRRGDAAHYLSYYTDDFARSGLDLLAQLPPLGESTVDSLIAQLPEQVTSGNELRTYRVAIAATGEYTIYHGGTVSDGLAAVVTALNRVNSVYERDVAVRMVLIKDNDLIIYTDPSTDPYSNNDGVAMLSQNQTNLDAVIGDANYDIGHVFSTGGGGVAYLEVPCVSGWKARGVTGLPNPIGDPFYIDYVAHEMGHQYGATHTFNGNEGSCSGGNRTAYSAYEPGSGTTVMAYAGICGSQDLQDHSDDDFHGVSFDQIVAYTTLGDGDTCAVTTTTGNQAPVVEAGTGGFYIPISTPFSLTGSATDPDGDPLTYDWEEWDLGPAGHPDSPSGDAPIFRSFVPVSTPTRIFPKISDIVNNTHTIGELLPTYTRNLTFRLTARDNHVAPSAGGVGYDSIAFDVTSAAGPFLVTAPNTAVIWTGNTSETVTWNVASTDLAPVSCPAVDISLSLDGGYTYPQTLLAGMPNDGSQEVTVPDVESFSARIKVACANNIFFDISNVNFIIESGTAVADLSLAKSVSPAGAVSPGALLEYTITVSNTGTLDATTRVTDTFAAGLVNPVCDGVPGDLDTTVLISNGSSESIECTAQADPALALQTSKLPAMAYVVPGSAITYTITVTNPNAIPVENLLVSDPDMGACTPALDLPLSLGAGASQVYTCPSVEVQSSTVSTATVTAEALLLNTAWASAPEDPAGQKVSNETASAVQLSAQASASVVVYQPLYLPAMLRTPEPVTGALPGSGSPLALGGGLILASILAIAPRKRRR